MKNENGQEKSAILKGQTMVNLIKGGDVKKEITYSGETKARYYFNKSMLKANVDYLLIYEVTDFSGDGSNISFNLNNDYGVTQSYFDKNGIYKTKVNFNDVGAIEDFVIFYKVTGLSLGGFINNVMLIEYQDGMENWDIPYFEGMQSVKMPVLTITGKNLFNKNNIIVDGYIISNGALVYETGDNRNVADFIEVEPNCIYSISGIKNSAINGERTHQYVGMYDKNKKFISSATIYCLSDSATFTTTENTKYIRVSVRNDDINRLQIEKGTTATTYEPCKSNILTVNEPVELRAVGDVQDTLDLSTGEVTECIGEIVLDGSQGFTLTGTPNQVDTLCILFHNFPKIANGAVMSDKLIKDYNYDYSDFECITQNTYGIAIRLLRNKLESADKNGVEKFLSQNPITVQYQLATESIKTVDLTIQDQDNQPQEHMRLFPHGHINTSSSTFPPILELKGITHNNKLNMTTTNGTNNTQLATLDNLALDGIICNNGTVVRDSYDVESGLYTKRVFRATIDEQFIEKYRNDWRFSSSNICFEYVLGEEKNDFPKSSGQGISNIMQFNSGGDINRTFVSKGSNGGSLYVRLLKEELKSYDVDGLLDWIKRNGAIEVAYEMSTPQIIHMQPNMQPYVSTRPYQGSIESQGNILESSFLDYTSEQSIISPKPLGDGDVLRWEQGSQCYVYENDKEYIPLVDYNQPMGTVLDLEEEDGEQFVENLDGGEIVVDVPFKEKAVYERHLVPYEDKVIYPTQDKLDPTGKIEVDYICGETWQNPNDLADIRHVGTLREDGQYDVTIRRSGDDEIRLMDGTTHISLDGDGLNPSEFELTFFNSGGVEVGKYGDTSHTLEDCVLDSKLETGTVYGDTLVNLIDTTLFYNSSSTVTRDNDGWITVPGDGNYVPCRHTYQGNLKTDTLYTLIVDVKSNTCSAPLYLIDKIGGGNAESAFTIQSYYIASKATGRFIQTLTTKSDLSGVKCDFRGMLNNAAKTGESIVFRYMLLEGDYTSYSMDIPYFEGVGSTIVNGFTVSNSDDTEMVQYNLPSPITLNKIGDVVDTYDVVSGVETRNIEVLTAQIKNLRHNDNYVGIVLGDNNAQTWFSVNDFSDGINTLGLPYVNVDLCPGTISNIIEDYGEAIGQYGGMEFKIVISKSRMNLSEYTIDSVNTWLKNNLTLYFVLHQNKKQTIQHTYIPSSIQTTQEPTFILPQPLRSVQNGICDRLYWNENKGHYCIEKRIGYTMIDGTNKNCSHDIGADKLFVGAVNMFDIGTYNMSYGLVYSEGWKTISDSEINKNPKTYPMPVVSCYNTTITVWIPGVAKNTESYVQYFRENPTKVYHAINPEIIDLPHLNKKLTLSTQPDTLPIGYKVEHTKANPQLGLTIPYKQLNYPSRPQNIDFKMDIADYVLTWDDVKEARQYNVILNDRVIATVKEPQWNSGEEMYGYIMVEAQNELAENLSEELYIKTVPNAPAQLTVGHNPMTNYYDFEISFIKTSAIAEYYTVQYRIDGGEWVYKTIQSDEIDPNSKVLWRFSVYEINEQIEVWATATNEIGTNDILPIATYYMSPTPQWTYRINSKELFVRWMDDSPYDTQYKLRYQYKSDGIFRYAYFEGDKQEIGKLYEALIPLADDEEVSIALCVISEKENLYTKPIKASKELDPNIKPPKNFNYHWLARGLIEFYWEDNYDVDVEYEAIVEHRLTSGNNEWITDTRIFSATDTEGTGTVYRLSYQMEDLEEIRVKVRMKWAMNETEWSESLTTVFIPVEGNPPQWIRRTQTQEGLLVEWEAQEYVDSYHVYVMSNGEELQHLETMDNFIYVDLDYSNSIDIEIYEATRFSGGIQSDPSDKMQFRPTMDKHQLIHDVVTPDTLTYEIEVDTIQKGIKERQVIHDINTTPKVTSKQPMDVAISSPFTLSFHPLQLDVHQSGSKYYGDTELHIKTLDVKSRDSIEILTFERITDQYGVDFTVYTPSASKYPITLEVNRVRIVCFGDSLTSGHPGFWMVV